jgi:hypothetical protein
MARSSGRDWSLDNAEALHQAHPRSFFIPSVQRRQRLRHDDWVRLVFLVVSDEPEAPSGQRMWLTEIRQTGEGRYIGVLTNAPAAIKDLSRGEEIEFGPEHVITIRDPEAIPSSLLAFANRRLIEDDTLLPRYVFHDPSERDRPPTASGRRSSGWCLFVGDESDDEVNNAGNVLTPDLGWLAERYPAFGELVRQSPGGREYEWDTDRAAYVDIGPYVPSDE